MYAAPDAFGMSTIMIGCCATVIYKRVLKEGALVVYQAEVHHVVHAVCADESDDEQGPAAPVPSARISTSMVNQATAHLQKDGR